MRNQVKVWRLVAVDADGKETTKLAQAHGQFQARELNEARCPRRLGYSGHQEYVAFKSVADAKDAAVEAQVQRLLERYGLRVNAIQHCHRKLFYIPEHTAESRHWQAVLVLLESRN